MKDKDRVSQESNMREEKEIYNFLKSKINSDKN